LAMLASISALLRALDDGVSFMLDIIPSNMWTCKGENEKTCINSAAHPHKLALDFKERKMLNYIPCFGESRFPEAVISQT
ncbi:MAG: hypothetical protein J6T51_08195, partial [Kiritimatiellae bacterium]|nr:hypothetical protein [Kiritimatiellia bacterium]